MDTTSRNPKLKEKDTFLQTTISFRLISFICFHTNRIIDYNIIDHVLI